MKNSSKIIRLCIGALLCTVLFSTCSTKKNTFSRRLYHNLTSRYNAYFNGNESLKEGLAALEEAHDDDYSKILPVYKLGTSEDATAQNAFFERAYKKASKVIAMHSIYIRKKEYVKWIPEAYILIGRSYYYKQDYKPAAETFDYVVKTYKEYPSKFNACLWLAKSYTRNKKYEKAQSTLDQYENKVEKTKIKVPKQAIKEFPLVYADFNLEQGKYEKATEYLIDGIDKNKKKSVRVRLRYILAQVYQEMGKTKSASKQYDKVIKMNPPYEMAFNARINKALCYDAGSGDSKEIKKLLGKMARDIKNKDYLDQIYYVLAEICMKEKDTACAVENYKLSATSSVTNDKQKATSYLKLGCLYFSMPEYELAEMYYDSAMTVLPKDYPGYDKISVLADVLKDLVKNLKVVELQDSLQKLSKLTPEQKAKVVEDIITRVIKEEQKKQLEEYEKQKNLNQAKLDEYANKSTASAGSSWYFYNPTTVNFGKTEFAKEWGSRKLEDLWRLSNKTAEADFGTDAGADDTATSDSAKAVAKSSLKDKNYYLKNIPKTSADLARSDSLIADALYNIGYIYQNDLEDLPEAVYSYEDLIKRFPSEKNYSLKTCYQLYVACDDMGNDTRRDYYKNLVCSKAPESDYCNIIKNPDFRKITSENKDKAAELYKGAYEAYSAGNWDSVMTKTTRGIELYGSDTSLAPKFSYLKALAYTKNRDTANIIKTLQIIIDKFPLCAVAPKARDLSDFWKAAIKADAVEVATDSATATDTTASTIISKTSTSYTADDDAIHLYVMVVNVSKTAKVSEIKNSLSDFNTKNFSVEGLTISNVYLDNSKQIITITNFENKSKAMQYYKFLKTDKDVFAKLKPSDYVHFVISVDNYPVMYKNKDVDNYYLFFNKNYK